MANSDFQAVVDQYLSEGRIYKPAQDFIYKLSLCPRYIGGQEKSKDLLDAILKMVNLVKKKLENSRNKTGHRLWLQAAAKELDKCCIANRDWISKNVWKLPEKKVTVSQDYDPDKGRKDIRFLTPSKDDKEDLAAVPAESQEELDFELDLATEEALLASPKSRSSQQEPMEVCPPSPKSSSPKAKDTVSQSPRRSPRKPKKTVKFQISPIKAPSPKPEKQQAGKKQQSRHAERHSSRRRDEEASSSSSSRSTHTIKTQVHDKSGRSSSSVKRVVTMGRGMTVDYAKCTTTGKRMAPLTISTTLLKRQKTDDVLRQVRETVDERRKTGGKRKDKKCWVPDCNEPTSYPKVHAFQFHIPGCFDERLQPDDERVLRLRRNALNQAARWLLGKPATLEELLSFIVIQKVLSTADNTTVSPVQTKAMTEMCNFLGLTVPSKFNLEPANSPAVLIHWRAVLLIAAMLTGEERCFWRDNFPVPEGAEIQHEEMSQDKHLPEAFDSHFHLDRTSRKLKLASLSLKDAVAMVPVDEDKRVKLVGTVAIFCDPASYPTERDLSSLPEDMTVVIGFHPKHAIDSNRRIQSDLRSMTRLLRHSRVTGLGEVGLDHSEPEKDWYRQVELLEQVLPLLQDEHVLVIHCRGMKDDCGTEAYLLLLHKLKRKVRPNHPIHLHCFTGNQYVVQRWLAVFPRTYFGFTNLVRSFNSEQIEALKSIDESRLLLESDAPYFPVMGARVSSPSQLYVAAMHVAEHRQSTPERILEVTVGNAQCLYMGRFQ